MQLTISKRYRLNTESFLFQKTETVAKNSFTKISISTSWDELSSHQAEAVSLNLASRYGYITTVKHREGAIKAQVGFNLCFDAISGNRENFDFNHLHQQFLDSWGGGVSKFLNFIFTIFLAILDNFEFLDFNDLSQTFWGVSFQFSFLYIFSPFQAIWNIFNF